MTSLFSSRPGSNVLTCREEVVYTSLDLGEASGAGGNDLSLLHSTAFRSPEPNAISLIALYTTSTGS